MTARLMDSPNHEKNLPRLGKVHFVKKLEKCSEVAVSGGRFSHLQMPDIKSIGSYFKGYI